MKRILGLVFVLAVAALLAPPALSVNNVVTNGIDLWRTPGDGRTHAGFADDPIPAGFFCPGSAAFTGTIAFKGVPVATAERGALGRTDTIVQRLDDAAFNARGVAVTRIQVRALEFVSLKPVETSCGAFQARVVLDGTQPITRMRIIQEHANGGHFLAPIAVNVKIAFTPVAGAAGEPREIPRQLRFQPNPTAVWSWQTGQLGHQHPGFVQIVVNHDRSAATNLPGTSNFAAGWWTNGTAAAADASQVQAIIHCADPPYCTKSHFTEVVLE